MQLTPSHPPLSQPQIVSPAMPNIAFVSVLEAPHLPNNLLYAPTRRPVVQSVSTSLFNQPSGTLLPANNYPVTKISFPV